MFNAWSLTCQAADFLGLGTYYFYLPANPWHTQSISGRSSRLLLKQASVPPVVGVVEDATCGLTVCCPTCALLHSPRNKFDQQPPPIPNFNSPFFNVLDARTCRTVRFFLARDPDPAHTYCLALWRVYDSTYGPVLAKPVSALKFLRILRIFWDSVSNIHTVSFWDVSSSE